MSIDEFFTYVRKCFESEERSRAMLRERDDLSLPLVIRQNENKLKTEGLNILVFRLSGKLKRLYHPNIILNSHLKEETT